ncbi:MAG: copper transporter, partial [Armatimonadetes bacterium]|nr:copper transporter [Armatimonadota bacterium]
MVDYRTYLTAFVAMFLALALGMLIGSALVGSPSTDRQQKELRALQQSFTQFNKQFGELREQSDNLKERL